MRRFYRLLFLIVGFSVGGLLSEFVSDSYGLAQGPALSLGVKVLFAILFGVLARPIMDGALRFNNDLSATILAKRPSEVLSGLLGLVVGFLVLYLLLSTLYLSPHTSLFLEAKGPSQMLTFIGGFLILYLSVLTLVAADPLAGVLKRGGGKGGYPKILDTNVILDGRIDAVLKAGFLEGPLLVPDTVIEELHLLADSRNHTKRTRGRKGLQTLNEMLERRDSPLRVLEEMVPDKGKTDEHLVLLAEVLGAALITNDLALNRVAQMRKVKVMNLNELALALRPHFSAGDNFPIEITRIGSEDAQGVGHLGDGTMVVVEDGSNKVGETVEVQVKSILQTEAGQIVFTRVLKS
ncbi:TRAM domain-containing protein [bacterium]|nr:TRAM domain-containing protein [bacterium]